MSIPTEPIGSIPRPPELIAAIQARALGQTKPSFATYPLQGLPNLAPDGVTIPFADGHTRQLPRLTAGPFRYRTNRVLRRFSPGERTRIGVHTCPGGDRDATHSAEVDYAALLPSLFEIQAGNFYLQMASEKDPRRVLAIVRRHARPDQRIFVGVTDPLNPRVETPEQVCDRVLEAAEFIPPDRLGSTDDCGFSPFSDDTSTDRDTAFAKIRARVAGTAMAAARLRL